MNLSTKHKFSLLLIVALSLMAVATGLYSAFSVGDTLSEKMRESGRNAVMLSADNVRDRYDEWFRLKAAQAIRVKDTLALYQRLIVGLTDGSGSFIDRLSTLALPGDVTVWVVDEKLRTVLVNGNMPKTHNPYIRNDIKGRAVGENMLRLASGGMAANALVEFDRLSGLGHKYFGVHFFLGQSGLLVGLWADLKEHEAGQAENLRTAIASLQSRFEKITIGPSGFLFVIDANGKAVVRPRNVDIELLLSGRPLVRDIVEGAATPDKPVAVELAVPMGKRKALAFVEEIRPFKWYVAGISFVDEITAPGRNLSLSLVAVIVVTAVFVLAIGLPLIGSLTAPLAKLAEFARQLPQTDFFQDRNEPKTLRELASGERGEIAELAKVFLFMERALRARVRELVESAGSRERMEGELKAATEIQMGFLPRPLPENLVRGRFSIAGCLIPAREVGGDLYDYFMPDDEHLCMVVGDVSGKGVPAALFMSMTMVLVRSAVEGHSLRPDDLMRTVNDNLSRENPNTMFVTLFIAIVNLRTGTLSCANAGHNPPILMDRDGVAFLDEPGGPVAGVFEGAEYRSTSRIMKPGQRLILYTDGIPEAMNADGEFFGEERMLQCIADTTNVSPGQSIRHIRESVDAFTGDAPASDDLTILYLALPVE